MNNRFRPMRLAWLAVVGVACLATGSLVQADDQDDKQAEAARQLKIREDLIKVHRAQLEAVKAQNDALQRMVDLEQRQVEIEQVLTGRQLGAMGYDDFTVDDVEFTRDHVVVPQRVAVAAGYFEQLVFGSRGVNAAAEHLNRLDLSLRTKVGALNLACGLSHRQTRQLELAGQGDIKRLFERINRRIQEYQAIRDDDAERAMRNMLQEGMAFQPLLRSPFGDDSLFAKTLKHILTAEQRSDYELSHQIERLGGKIMLRSHGSDEFRTLRVNAAAFADYRLAPWKGWGSLRGLSLESTSVVDDDLARINRMSKLELLDLGGTHVSSAGLVHLQELHELKVLDLRRTEVTDAGLAHLSRLTYLKNLNLGGTNLTGAGLVHLSSLHGLESLFLYQTSITDADLVHVAKLHDLQELGLDGTPVTDAGLAHLSGLTSLRTLALSNTAVTDAALAHLKPLANLKTLTLYGTKISEAGAASLKRAVPGLKVIR